MATARGVGRFGEAHVLAGAQPLHGAGLEAGFDDAILVRLVPAHDGVLGIRRDHETGKERRDLGLDQGGVVELVELVELDQRPGEPGLAPDLAGTEWPEEVGDAVRRHPHQIVVARAHDRIAGMGAGQVVGGAPAQPVELDAGAHQVAARQCRVEGERYVLGLQELDLKRHRETVLGPAHPQAHETFAALQHGPAGERLEAVEVGDAVGVGFLAPIPPQRMHGFAECRIGGDRLRLDAGADTVGDEGVDGTAGPGVAAHQIARLDPAAEIEAAVVHELRALLRAPEVVVATWRAARKEDDTITEAEVRETLHKLDPLWEELFPAEQARLIRLLVRRVEVHPEGLRLHLRVDGLRSVVAEMREEQSERRAA